MTFFSSGGNKITPAVQIQDDPDPVNSFDAAELTADILRDQMHRTTQYPYVWRDFHAQAKRIVEAVRPLMLAEALETMRPVLEKLVDAIALAYQAAGDARHDGDETTSMAVGMCADALVRLWRIVDDGTLPEPVEGDWVLVRRLWTDAEPRPQ